MNTLIAVALIFIGCGVGTFIALAILAMSSMNEDEE
jgi:hypothetical protein